MSRPNLWEGFEPGSVIAGRYRVRDLIGAGGMGAVVVADDLLLRKPVALKAMLPQLARSEADVERFRREVALAHSVTHPGVARTYDLGQHEDVLFFSMEYLGGESLKDRLKREGRLSVADTRRLAVRICAALQAAHDAGIVHRDLKPGNIMLVPDAREVVLMDFGISGFAAERVSHDFEDAARQATDEHLSPEEASLQRLRHSAEHHPPGSWTVTSAGLGTPVYMAPEQWKGLACGPPTDLYALGTILFECLTGRPVFNESNDPYYFVLAHLNEDAPRLRSVDPALPRDLDVLIARTQLKDPALRFQSARDLAGALAGSGGARRWLRPLGLAAAAGVLIALAAFGLFAYSRSVILDELRPGAACLAELTSRHMDAGALDTIRTPDDVAGDAFGHLCSVFDRMATIDTEVAYIYVLRQLAQDGGWEVVADHDYTVSHTHETFEHSDLHGGHVTTGTPYVTQTPEHIRAAQATTWPTAEEGFSENTFGYTLSAFAPIGEGSGAGAYVLGVDVGNERLTTYRTIVILASVALWLVLVMVIVLSEKRRVHDPLAGVYDRAAA